MANPFYLGLNMSGTVSAGPYSAGVMDFLIEAMDAWYAERDRQIQQFGHNYELWTIPPHELQLAAMAGASGGGITAALSAAVLSQKFNAVHDQSPVAGAAVNPLFKSWVSEIDLKGLLGHADLDSNGGQLVSILDSTPIRNIAAHALQIGAPLPQRRPWVRDGLKVILTLTNLRGTPYAIEPKTNDSALTLYYADHRTFQILWSDPGAPGEVVHLDARGGAAWSALADAAVATSAFPVVLAPQLLNRTAGEYNNRMWRIASDNPKPGADGTCGCETNARMPPAWNLSQQDSAPFQTLNVDGGATNNSPFDCVRVELADLAPPLAAGHNLRDPKLADRGVVSIAPLFTKTAQELPPLPTTGLASLLGQFVNVIVNQSRIQGESLKLTSDPKVASRWVIAPTSENSAIEPLAGALLSAFAGFISHLFREHDYQLGRRNCQRFLTRYFGLPWDNVILKQYNLSSAAQARLDAIYGFPSEADPAVRHCSLIPVLPQLRAEIKVVRKPIQQSDLRSLADLALDRLKRVAHAVIMETGSGAFSDFAFDTAWLFVKGRLRDAILNYAGHELAKQGFVD